MYTLCLRRAFVARHFLTAQGSGSEGLPHSHAYTVELRIGGEVLDEDGYLIDLRNVERVLERSIDLFRDRLLNDLPAFTGLNPSLERFCRILAEEIAGSEGLDVRAKIEVRLWENENAWASWSGVN